MYYEALANELLRIRTDLLRVPASRQLSKMTRGELFVLNYLRTQEDGVHPKELSEKMSVSTARIAALLKHMEEKGQVCRRPDPQNSRQVLVRLTEAGRAEIEKDRREVLLHTAQMLERLGPDDAREYVRILEKICLSSREEEEA
ncbi:MAG: MarR family winged helix-turn-helix transcriptional regulator [Oscillospiraceae bacterium]